MKSLAILTLAIFLSACSSIDPAWDDISSQYTAGTKARTGEVGAALYLGGPGSGTMKVLRGSETLVILEPGAEWSKIRNAEHGDGWIATREIIPLSSQ